MEKHERNAVDITIFLLIVAVIVMKFTGIITVSWVVLLSPIWILFLACTLMGALILTVAIIKGLVDEYKERKNERD